MPQSSKPITVLALMLSTTLLSSVSLPILAVQDEQKTKVNDSAAIKKAAKPAQVKNNSPVVPLPISLAQQYTSDLKHYIPANTLVPILAGPNDYLSLVTKNTAANTKGVVILFPDWQQGAVNPKAINYLRQAMPKQGWTTISIQPHNKPQNFPSTTLSKEEQQKENETSLDEYKIKLSMLNNALFAKAKEFPGIVIVVAQGNIGALLIDLYDQGSEPPNGLVLLSSHKFNSHAFIDETNSEFAEKLAMSEYPVLDLYLKYDHPIVIDKAPERLALASQEMKVYYRQRQLNNITAGFYPEQELLRQITGWLKSIGW